MFNGYLIITDGVLFVVLISFLIVDYQHRRRVKSALVGKEKK